MKKSNQFHDYFSILAKKSECDYLNLGDKVKVSDLDGLHLDQNGHKKVGILLASAVKSLFTK